MKWTLYKQSPTESKLNIKLDSNLVKGVVDTGSGLLDGATSLIDGIGAIQTVVGGFAAFKGIKSFVKNFDSPKITGTVNFRYFT